MAVVAALAASQAATAAPDSAKGVAAAPPAVWIRGFCGAFVSWKKTAEAGAAKVQRSLAQLEHPKLADLPAVKRELVDFLHGVSTASDRLHALIAKLGPPSIPNGSKLEATLNRATSQVASAYRRLWQQATRISTNPLRMVAQATKLGKDISAAGNKQAAAFSALGQYSSSALDRAAASEPSCKALTG